MAMLQSIGLEKNVLCGYIAGVVVTVAMHFTAQVLGFTLTADQSAAMAVAVTGGVAHVWDYVAKILAAKAVIAASTVPAATPPAA